MAIQRRRVLKSVFGLPLAISAFAKFSGARQSGTPACGTPMLGLIRRLNTAQNRFKFENNAFAEHQDLIPAATNWFPNDRQAEEPLKKALSEESTPGWSLRLHLSPVRDAYLLSLSTTEATQPNVFVSDERGVIYFGVLPSQRLQPESYAPLNQAYPELSPLQAPNPTTGRKILRWAQQLAFSGLGIDLPDACYCGGTCRKTVQPICCNVGYLNCPWCCYDYCGTCQLICYGYCGAPCYGC